MKKFSLILLTISTLGISYTSHATTGEPVKESGDLCCDKKTGVGTCCAKTKPKVAARLDPGDGKGSIPDGYFDGKMKGQK